MIPSWYPTKENPISGSFFKEQAKELSKYCNMVVLAEYKAKSTLALSYLIRCILSKSSEMVALNGEGENFQCEIGIKIYVWWLPHFIKRALRRLGIAEEANTLYTRRAAGEIKKLLIGKLNFMPQLLYGMTAQVNCLEVAGLAGYLSIPYALVEHSPFPVSGTAITQRKQDAMNSADLLLAISNDKIRQMQIQGITKKQEYIGNMVDEDLFCIRKDAKIDDIFTILTVAAYNDFKDYETFFKAVTELRRLSNIPFKIMIVGYAPNTIINRWNLGAEAFEEKLKEYDIFNMCELVPKAERAQMPGLYNKADVFVMTSIQEGMPVSALEATSCGIPVYSTRCGGVEDYITEDNGVIVNVGDYKSLALRLKDMMDGKVKYNPSRIRKITVKRFGKKAFCENLMSKFDGVLNERRYI